MTLNGDIKRTGNGVVISDIRSCRNSIGFYFFYDSVRILKIKSQFVMELMQSRLQGLGVDWSMVGTTNVYTRHSMMPLVPENVLERIGASSIHGATWHYSQPPIEEIEYEMDLRGTRTDLRH